MTVLVKVSTDPKGSRWLAFDKNEHFSAHANSGDCTVHEHWIHPNFSRPREASAWKGTGMERSAQRGLERSAWRGMENMQDPRPPEERVTQQMQAFARTVAGHTTQMDDLIDQQATRRCFRQASFTLWSSCFSENGCRCAVAWEARCAILR
jgi:hypothetical protein